MAEPPALCHRTDPDLGNLSDVDGNFLQEKLLAKLLAKLLTIFRPISRQKVMALHSARSLAKPVIFEDYIISGR
jgi:hypothetical protein